MGSKRLMNIVGHNIRYLRLRRGWNQAEVSSKLKVTITAVSKIELGHTDVNFSRLEQIAQLFDITPAELFTVMGKEQSSVKLETTELDRRLQERDAEIRNLRKKIIELYDELIGLPSQ